MSVGFNNFAKQSFVSPSGYHFKSLWIFMTRIPVKIRNLIVLVAAAASGVIFFLEDWQRDLTVNHARFEEAAQNPFLRPITLSMSPEAAALLTRQWANQKKLWDVSTEASNDNNVTLELTRRTAIFRFIDDVKIEFRETKGGVRIHAESRSRVGKGDLGQNPRNLIELSKAFLQMKTE